MSDEPALSEPVGARRRGCLFYGCLSAAVLLLVVCITALGTAWWVKRQVNARPIVPTELTPAEQKTLDQKLELLGGDAKNTPPPDKVVTITEKEINGLLAKNTNLGDKCYVSVERNAIGARCNIPVQDDVPVLGGKTLRGRVEVRVALDDQQLDLRVQDVTVAGVSLPNAWLGGVKDVNLAQEYFAKDDVLKAFLAGIESLSIDKGRITMILAE
jgi:hypothetical protein